MNWFLDFSTRNKLFAGFGVMLVFLAAVIATAYLNIAAIQESQKKLYQEEFANAVDLMKLRSSENGIRAAALNMMLVVRHPDQETWH